MEGPMRFGIFLAPFHPVGQNPTLALERDLELVVRLDQLGFDEAWIGEHHSAGFEIIASPEVFIAVLAERTRHIRLGTGVSSLPYHHPLMIADRMLLLDHLTRGRVMMGVGPGALPSDAFMMGIDPMSQREMMEQSLEAILALLGRLGARDKRGRLVHASRREDSASALLGPLLRDSCRRSGLPGRPACSGALRSFTPVDRGNIGGWLRPARQSLAGHGGAGCASSATEVDRRKWRLVGPMHLAETEAQARADVEFGLAQWIDYFEKVAALPLAPQSLARRGHGRRDQQHRVRRCGDT